MSTQPVAAISRSEAARLVMERCFGFEAAHLYAEWSQGEAVVWLPEAVRINPDLARRFSDPETGVLGEPNTLCVLIPDAAYAARDIGVNGITQRTPRGSPEPYHWRWDNKARSSWHVVPDVFHDADTVDDLKDMYAMEVQLRQGRWQARSANDRPASAEDYADAIVLCALSAEGIRVEHLGEERK
jgi:hypothetical protein